MLLALDVLLSEFDAEMALARDVLARVPDEALAWRPHERSFSMSELATHVALLPRWGQSILERSGYDLGQGADVPPRAETSRDRILELFDRNLGDVRARLRRLSAPELAEPWTLSRGGHVVMSMPRLAAVRRFLMNHLVHHRGQLTVYLRLQNVPLPPMYGPSADERM